MNTSNRATIKADVVPDEALGQVLGRYKLLEKIGEGGFGVVYVAEQKEPVKRRVALKIIKLGMDTRQVVARFEAERQALALMDHPNFAKVLDAGALARYRDLQAQGANHLVFRQHFARALYVQALAEPSDASGLARRGSELDEGERLLQGLPEEARQLHDSKELLSWIAAERTQTNQARKQNRFEQ